MYAFIILMKMSLMKLFDFGPSSTVTQESEKCRERWWKNLLYIHNLNFKDPKNFANMVIEFFCQYFNVHINKLSINLKCMSQSWYLSNDMQMFIVSPIFVYALWKSKIWGLVFSGKHFSPNTSSNGFL